MLFTAQCYWTANQNCSLLQSAEMPFEAMAPKEYFPSQEAAEFGRWSNLDSPGGAAAKA